MRIGFLCILVLAACAGGQKTDSRRQNGLPPGKFDFQVQYLYSGETFYESLTVRDNTMVRRFFNDEGSNCAKVQRSPCWSEEELTTVTAKLDDAELAAMKKLVDDTSFMVSDPDPHGLTGKQRFYAYIITVTWKNAEHSVKMGEFPGSTGAPPASRSIYLKLLDLAKKKGLGS